MNPKNRMQYSIIQCISVDGALEWSPRVSHGPGPGQPG